MWTDAEFEFAITVQEESPSHLQGAHHVLASVSGLLAVPVGWLPTGTLTSFPEVYTNGRKPTECGGRVQVDIMGNSSFHTWLMCMDQSSVGIPAEVLDGLEPLMISSVPNAV